MSLDRSSHSGSAAPHPVCDSEPSVPWTPGPWRAAETWRPPIGFGPCTDKRDANGNIFWGYSISGSNEHGGHILPSLAAVHNFPDHVHANARLIATAPELYAALAAICEELAQGDDLSAAQIARNAGAAALAKATGSDQEETKS